MEGKVVWDQLNRSLILHSKTFCKFLSLLLFLPLWENWELCDLSFRFSIHLLMLTFFKAQWRIIPLFVVFNWDLEEMYANKKIHNKITTNGYLKGTLYLVYYIPKNTMLLFLDYYKERVVIQWKWSRYSIS